MALTTTAITIPALYGYDRWANRRMLDAVSRLTDAEFTRDLGSSFPSVQATLAHLLAAHWVWLERWQGRSPSGLPDAGWDVGSFAALREKWSEVEAGQQAFVEALTDEVAAADLA